MADDTMQLPPGYEDAKPVEPKLQLPPGYEDAKPVAAKTVYAGPKAGQITPPPAATAPTMEGAVRANGNSYEAAEGEQAGTVGEQQAIAQRAQQHPVINAVGKGIEKANDVAGKMAGAGAKFGKTVVQAPVVAATAIQHLPETASYMLTPKMGPAPNLEDPNATAAREHPIAMGVSGAVGGMVGGMVADPRQWPLLFLGGETVGPLIQKAISAGFGANMAQETIEGAKQLGAHWDEMTPEERAEQITSLGLSSVFAGMAGAHVMGGEAGARAGYNMGRDIVHPVPETLEVKALAKETAKAEKVYDAAKAAMDNYKHSLALPHRVNPPEKTLNAYDKAAKEFAIAKFHEEVARDAASKAAQTRRTGNQPAAQIQPQAKEPGKVTDHTMPVQETEPEITAKPEEPTVLGKLGAPKAPPTVSPAHATATIPQEPTEAPKPSYGRIALANDQGTMGAPKQLTEGTPEGPQIPKGGLPKINLPEEKPAPAPKIVTDEAALRALSAKKGEVVETPQDKVKRLLVEALKSDKGTNQNFPAATVEETPTEKPVVEEHRAAERRAPEPTLPEGQEERRQNERRVLQGMNERTFTEGHTGQGEEKPIDTDAYARATEQARKELGPDATKEAVIARRNELVAPEAKGKTGDIGAKAREVNPEPTRAETKTVLPKEEPTGYAAKKEEVVPAGSEGREPVKSAAEYHPDVKQKVSELSDENLRKLAKAHGLNPDEYDFNARDERRHRTERDQLTEDIAQQMGEDEKINLGRAAEATEKQGLFQGADTSSKGRAARAEKMFPRLRGPVDENGNPKVSGGAPETQEERTGDTFYHGTSWDEADTIAKEGLKNNKNYVTTEPWAAKEYAQSKTEDVGDKHAVVELKHPYKNTTPDPEHDLVEGEGDLYRHTSAAVPKGDIKEIQYFDGDKLVKTVKPNETVGTKEAADKDNEHFANAKKELPNGSISEVAKRAQEMKDAATKPDLKKIISDYSKKEGLEPVKDNKIEVDPRSKEIARAYDDMKHDPSNPEVKKSYAALIDDAKKQWDALTKAGIKLEPQDEDPYKSYDEMKKDFDDNKRLKVFRGGEELPEDHPLAKVDPKTGETYNVMFRAVHDAIGHLLHDNDFSEKGESNAFDTHRQTMSKEAIPAMTTETKAQVASYFDKGKFPEQKAGILPDKYTEDAPDPKAVLDHLKSGKDYALLTAENPNNERATPEQNAQKNREMKAELEKMGYKPTPIEGHVSDVEGQKENSFFVPDISPKDAAKVSRKFGQASVMTKQGIHDLVKDTVHPSTGILEGDEAAKQDYHSTVAGKPFSVSVDFNKEEDPQLPTVSGGAPEKKLPTGDQLIKKYGESSGDPKDLTFILKDGRGVKNTGNIHDEMLGGKATDKNPPRERFVAEGNIRVRPHQGPAGREITFSIPESGVSAEQLKYIQKMSPQLRSGAVMIEVGKPGGSYKAIPYGQASPEAIETAIRGIGPVLNDKGAPIDWYGNPTVSGGSQSAGTGTAKSKATPEDLQKSLPDLAQKHLTNEEKASLTTTATGKPRTAGTEKFISNMEKIPTVQEYTDIAQQGEGARKWHSRSSAAFDAMAKESPDYFKKGDKEKFLGMLAGSSPQQAVVSNLRETLGLWKAWVDAGRPEVSLDKWKQFGEAADEAWKEDGSPRARGMAKGASMHWDYAPKGAKWDTENMLLKHLTLPETKVPNIAKALNGEKMWPDLTKNSAFKAPSFAENLRKWLDGKSTGTKNVTNDSWMGLFGGIDKSALSRPENYHPLSVATRAAAEALGWEPEEAQAAIWSFTQALTEKGTEDPEVVRHYSEDFADLLGKDGDAEVRSLLEGLGVNLDDIDRRLERVEKKPEVSGRSTPTTSHSVGQLRSRIEEARGKGSIPEPKSIQGSLFKENPAFEHRVNPGSGHTRSVPTELERIKAEEQAKADKVKAEQELNSPLKKLGSKESAYKDKDVLFSPEEFETESELEKLGEKKRKSPLGKIR